MNLYSIRDVLNTDTPFAMPFGALNSKMAIRNVMDALKSDKNLYNNAKDYTLVLVGKFDQKRGFLKDDIEEELFYPLIDIVKEMERINSNEVSNDTPIQSSPSS